MSGDKDQSRPKRSYALMRWFFLRMFSIVYLIAFLSLFVQIKGLIGSHGIIPAATFLENAAKAGFGFWQVPTVAWINYSDAGLQLIPLAGAFFAFLAMLGIVTAPALAMCWLFYLSLMTIGSDFLSFQWDSLLLETGFLAIFFSPWQMVEAPWKFGKANASEQPPRVILFLLRLLLFKLLFLSGMCKIASGDPTWQNLTALTYHYETQPLPTPLAWFGNQLPLWFQQFSCGFVFFEELIVPFFIFAPYRLRLLGASLMLFLQLMIATTGNYAFFNLLTIVLIFTLLDDSVIARLVPAKIKEHFQVSSNRQPGKVHSIACYACVALIATIFLCQSARGFSPLSPLREPAREFLSFIAPYQIVNSYGLFAIMTTSRPEIIIEGSMDGHVWQEYEFYFKPGNVNLPPPLVAPYQPRLDWQMWFAALTDYQNSPWFISLVRKLLDGQPDVLALLKTNPFPDKPPRYIRGLLYDYHFTNYDQQKATGAWWRRVAKGVYFPVATLGNN